MSRASYDKYMELKKSGVNVYSISRLDSINNCLYGAYRTYKLHDRGGNNVYAIMGSKIHGVLEDIVNGKSTEEDLLPALQEELEDMDSLGISFPKDSRGGDAIREGWITDMTHFCETYKSPKANLETEELFVYTTSKGYSLIGYIDLQKINKSNSIDIYDYKTSTMYTGEELKSHGRQLAVYTMGKEQEGKDVNKVAWIFLKYVEVKFLGKKTAKSKEKVEITKILERKKIGSEMAKFVERDLDELGYSEIDIEIILDNLKATNKFDCLPEEIRGNYKMIPCVYPYEITDEIRQECEDYINNTIEMWESLGDDVNNYPPRKFTKVQKNGKEVNDIFFCTNLCSHFKNCEYIHDFLDKQSINSSEDEDLF